MLPEAGLSDSGSGHEIPLAGRPWSGWGGGQAASHHAWCPAPPCVSCGARASVQGTPQPGDGPGPAPRWPGVPRRVSRDGGDTLLPFSLQNVPLCLVLLWLRGLGGVLWQRRGPSLMSAPETRSKVWIEPLSSGSTGGLWLDACGFRPALWKGRAPSSTHSSLCGTHRSRTPLSLPQV